MLKKPCMFLGLLASLNACNGAAMSSLMQGSNTGRLIQAISSSPQLSSLMASLTGHEQEQRQEALQAAASAPVGHATHWTSHDQTAQKATRARYVNVGQTTNSSGQKCSKIHETITMPDGKTGTSEQLVCS